MFISSNHSPKLMDNIGTTLYMAECKECGIIDYPLDDKTGLCYTCWLLEGQKLFSMVGEEE